MLTEKQVKSLALLTGDEVKRLCEYTADSYSQYFHKLWVTLEPNYEELEHINPTEYVMSRDQVNTILDAWKPRLSDLGEYNAFLMLYLDKGPSSR